MIVHAPFSPLIVSRLVLRQKMFGVNPHRCCQRPVRVDGRGLVCRWCGTVRTWAAVESWDVAK
jgi:hypothetical protein